MAGHGEFESPVDLPRDRPGGRPLGWATLTIFTASLFLLVTNALTLKDWIDEQTASPLQTKLAAWAGEWEEATGSLGFGTPRAELRRLWKKGQGARFAAAPRPDQR